LMKNKGISRLEGLSILNQIEIRWCGKTICALPGEMVERIMWGIRGVYSQVFVPLDKYIYLIYLD
jgi:hypothetical protein